jgi:pimeloyl-ACP methyl ester carboxylesterase
MVTGTLLVIISFWQVLRATHGLRLITFSVEGIPVNAFLAENGQAPERPVILVAHGFAGSGTVMRSFALTLAHAGYNTLTWDFAGHGANPGSLGEAQQRDALVADAERALEEATQRGLVTSERIAIIGHSMGSGVALAYGQLHPETAATVAVSPVTRPVTTSLPRNLLLLAGTQEASFLKNGRRLLAQAGGEGDDIFNGTARRLVTISGANHLTILFSDQAHQTTLEWLNAVFGEQPESVSYNDRRIGWYALGVMGTLLAAIGLAWKVGQNLMINHPRRSLVHRLTSLLLGVLIAVFALWLLQLAGLDIVRLFGLLVGGYLMVWFALAGVTGLLVLRYWPGLLSVQTTLAGTLTFSVLWIGIGMLSHLVWQPWLMILPRLIIWPLAVVCLLPWYMLLGELVHGQGWLGQIVAWLAHSLLLLGGLFLAIQITPGIGFLILILPVFPIFFGFHALAAGPFRGGWPFALSGAMFTAWMLLVVFPLA